MDLFSKLTQAKKASVEATKRKKTAREDLDTAMSAILGQYETSINQLLVKFGAAFQIEKMATNFRGGAARSEYGLRLRGKSVQLEGGTPSFSTVLSEGDKRTLAFAFFVASTLEHPELSSRIVVIDDPMCSLDINRKQHTKIVLKQIRDNAEQLIVLAHDPYFLRDLRDELIAKGGNSNICSLQLRYTIGEYSDLGEYNVDKECESTYYRHHRTLKEFCETGTNEKRDVAKAIRPFLEGYLHRRFPGFIPRDLMFGQVVEFIKGAGATEPVSHAKNLITELQEINTYAGQFHHDTNPGFTEEIPVTHAELIGFSRRALRIVHAGNV
ncbi:AAA family ATPase [Undibacterium sp. Tian12W]|uniref:AAA family ATPase n=1 Tax=Undibacterium sp. Tian12W TaxID=3413054 RepID=UPI003BF248C0